MSPSAGRLLAASSICLFANCSPRKPLVVHDAGPAVEVVEADHRAPAARAKVPFVDEKEPNDGVASAQPMTPGAGLRGFIGAPVAGAQAGKPTGDQDVYSWMAPGPAVDLGFAVARVELSGVPGLDLALDVLDGDGKRLCSANDGGPGEPEVVANLGVDPAHTYYFRVREAGAPHGDPGHAYELTVASGPAAAGDEREPNDEPARATPIRLSSGTSGEASGLFGRKHDDDWLRLPLDGVPAGDGRATLRLELAPAEGVASAIRVQGDAAAKGGKAPLYAEARAGQAEELRLRNVGVDVAGGAVLVKLRALDGVSLDARWRLRFGLEPPLDGAEREPNNDAAHATPLPLSGGAGALAGFLWPGDVDVYRVQGGAADGLFTVEVEGVDKVDLKLEQLGADGKVLARADAQRVGQGETLPAARLGDGLYRVSARAHDVAFDAPYRIIVRAANP